jgi:hypothetical protein
MSSLAMRLRGQILKTCVGGRPLREILYPTYVKLYPFLFFMHHFNFDGQAYDYFFHPYGATLRGERIVEVPIVLEELRARAAQRVLEVGNVLSHYVACRHDIVDKYERAPGVLNEDILDYRPAHRYDFILSISTVEHIGWNEYEREPEKAVQALAHMRTLLAPGGRMLVTLPWGTNPSLDRHIETPGCLFEELRFMKRVSRRNTWRQTTRASLAGARYGDPYPFGNVLVIGSVGKRTSA